MTLLLSLRCPYCKGALRRNILDGDFGIVSCACDTYPIVAGIVYLQKNDAQLNKHIVLLISQKRYVRAVWDILSGSRVQKSIMFCVWGLRYIWGISVSPKKILVALKMFATNKSWFEYLLRRDNHSDLELAVRASNIKNRDPRASIVDIGCGIGSLYNRFRHHGVDVPYIGIDKNSNSLLFAHLYTDGNALWVCSDIEQGIPLVDASVTTVVFLDCFAWIFNKNRAVTEARRVLRKSGVLTIVNVFSVTARTRFWGYGISPDYLWKLLKTQFHTVTIFNNDHVDRIVGLPIRTIHKERYSCKAVK